MTAWRRNPPRGRYLSATGRMLVVAIIVAAAGLATCTLIMTPSKWGFG